MLQNVTRLSFILLATEWVRNMNVDEVRVPQLHIRFNLSFQEHIQGGAGVPAPPAEI